MTSFHYLPQIFTIPIYFLLALTTFLVLFNFLTKQSWKRLPPGPPNLPLLGSLPFLGQDLREPLRKLGAKYGDVFTVYLGTQRVVVLNSYEAIKEALMIKGQTFGARPKLYVFEDLQEHKGIVSASGNIWRRQRRFLQTFLRELSSVQTTMEDKVLEEVQYLLEELEGHGGQPLDPGAIINDALTNIIGSLVFGSRLNYHDAQFRDFVQLLYKHMELLKTTGILAIMPFLAYLPGDLFKLNKMRNLVSDIQKHLRDRMGERKAQLGSSDDPQDFIDAYLKMLEKLKDSDDEKDSSFSEGELLAVITDLYSAGAETTTTTLSWALAYLLHHPQVLQRVQQEIDDIVGSGRTVSMKDKPDMPFTEATLMEVQRMGDVVPFGLSHAATADVDFMGYHIPKDTNVMPNQYSVHRDERFFPDPFRFDPERFLDSDGRVKKVEQLIPFSLGRRMCLGESLGRMELFLCLVSILQRYTPSLPQGDPLPDLTAGTVAFTHAPPDFKLVFLKRAH